MANASQLLIVVGIIINVMPSYPAVTICIKDEVNSSADFNMTVTCDNMLTTLLDALELSHTLQNSSFGESISIFLAEGQYKLPATPYASFKKIRGFSMVGSSEATTIISCNPIGNTGLSFVESQGISIQKMTLTGCGQKHSTSGNPNSGNFPSVEFQASLYFEQCSDIILNGITVTNSIGIATYFYATTEMNLIYDSTFSSNNKSTGIEGQGLVIEFPYCLPEDTSCNNLNSSPSRDAVSNAIFNISGCMFEENNAAIYKKDTFSSVFSHFNKNNLEGARKGGGLSVLFEGHTLNNSITVTKCYFLDNCALFGGGLFIQFGDAASDNHVSIEECVFANNSALEKGGGSVVNFFQNGIQSIQNNEVQFHKSVFTGNSASHGGGLSVHMTREPNQTHSTNTLLLIQTNFTGNRAHFGSAADLSLWHLFHSGAKIEPEFDNCSFTNNRIKYKHDEIIGSATLYLDAIPVVFRNNVSFESNFGTPIVALSSEITFSNDCQALFRNNTGGYGGAISLLEQATMIVGERTSFDFASNTARHKGGALYASFEVVYDGIDSHNCFLQYIDSTLHPDFWETNFTFDSNKQQVNAKTNAIYATSILPCLWDTKNGVVDDSQLRSVFCWESARNTWGYKPSPICHNNINTEPANLGIGKRIPNISLIPGRLTLLQLNASDDLGNNVTDDLVFSLISHTVGVDDSHRIVSNNKILLRQENRTAGYVLLETEGSRSIGALVNVSFQTCPLGFTLTNGSCDNCVGNIKGYVECSSDFHLNVRQGFWIGPSPKDNSTLVTGLCKYCNTTAIDGDSFVLIPAFTSSQEEAINDQCQKGRTGTLCSQCIDNYSPAVNTKTFECVECPGFDGVGFFYLILDFIFTTFLYFVLLCTNFKLTSGPFSAVILYAQLLTTALGDLNIFTANILHSRTGAKILTSIYELPYGIWNLQFLIPEFSHHCISPGMPTATVLALRYITASYPFIWLVISVIVIKMNIEYSVWHRLKTKILVHIRPLYKCLDKCQLNAEVQMANHNKEWSKEANEKIGNAFSSAILLTYTEIALVTCYLLAPTPLWGAGDDYFPHMYVLYIDGQFTPYEYQYIIPGLLFGIIIMLFPLCLICFTVVGEDEEGKRYQPEEGKRCQSCYINYIHVLVNHIFYAFQKDFKNRFVEAGNDSCQNLRNIKRRYRKTLRSDLSWMAGVYFYFRLAMLIVFALSWNFAMQSAIQAVFCAVMAMIVTVLQPYREDWINKLDTCVFLLMAIIASLNIYQYYNIISDTGYSEWAFALQYILILLPLMYMVGMPVAMKCCKRRFQKNKEKECQNNMYEML